MTDPIPLLQYVRGMCSDEEPHHLIDAKIAEAIDAVEADRNRNVEGWFTEHPATGEPVMVMPTATQLRTGRTDG